MINKTDKPVEFSGMPVPGLLIALVLMVLHASLLLWGLAEKSPTFDEPAHVSKGLLWQWRGDHHLNTESGLLPSILARAALAGTDIELPKTPTGHEAGNIWLLADSIYHRKGNNPQQITYRSRLAMIGVSLLLAWLIWWIGRRHYGGAAGAMALTLYSLSPTVLAHARLANADLLLALTATAACYAFWQMMRHPGWRTVVGCGLITGLALLTKHSAWLLPIVFGLLVLVFRACNWTRKETALPTAASAFGLAVLVVWAAFGFQWSAGNDTNATLQTSWDQLRQGDSLVAFLAHQANRWHLLPEPVLHGVAYVAHHASQKPAFILGVHGSGGIPWFFPVTFVLKTPFASLLLMAAAAVAMARSRSVFEPSHPTLVLAAFCLAYLGMAVVGSINLGIRHLLPVYPALFILVGSQLSRLYRRQPGFRLPLAGLLCLLLIETAMAAPHYLSFFNRASGGWQKGHRYLVDSSNDWGQDLPQLAHWMAANQLSKQDVFLAYFGTAEPLAWGVDATPLPSFPNGWKHPQAAAYGPGSYVISATMLQCIYCGPFSGRWDSDKQDHYRLLMEQDTNNDGGESITRVWARFARLMDHLRKREPDDFAAPSMPVYKLSKNELQRAGLGPRPVDQSPQK